MRRNLFGIMALVGVLSGCGWNATDSEVERFQERNIMGKDLAIGSGEVALTFDDGPAGRTLELAKFLQREDVPATFFMTGQAAAQYESTVKALSEMRGTNGRYLFNIANHTQAHTSLPNGEPVAQVRPADRILSKYVKGYFFFRAPYGAWRGSLAAPLNGTSLVKYVGPVFWDIGGELSGGYAADWACWPKGISASECGRRYLAETRARNGGILLAHDVHSKTVDMMIGSNGSSSLVRSLKEAGFRFVALDKSESRMKALGGIPAEPLPPEKNLCESGSHQQTPFRYVITGQLTLQVYGDGGRLVAELPATRKNGALAKLGGRDVAMMYDARSGTGNGLFVYKLLEDGKTYLKHDNVGDLVPMTCTE